MSNFPGPGVQLELLGHKLVTCDAAIGLLFGAAGVSFQLVRYCQHLRISVLAEKAIMDQEGLSNLVNVVVSAIDNYYELSRQNQKIEVKVE